jgi:hypothetical protein
VQLVFSWYSADGRHQRQLVRPARLPRPNRPALWSSPPVPRATSVVSFLPPFSEALAQAASRHDSISCVSTRIASRALIGFRQQTWLADAVRPIQRVNMPVACPNLVRFANLIDPFSPPRGWPMTMHQPQLLRIDHPETPSRADNEFG